MPRWGPSTTIPNSFDVRSHTSRSARMTKRCPRCGVTKAIEEFARNRSSRSGYGGYCKRCHNQVVRSNRLKHYGSTRSFHLTRRCRVDATQVAWIILQQGGVCALCGTGKPEHVDHDHQTKRVRGILCFNCNRGLGKFGDDVELMNRAVQYLERALSR
ncbi:MAG: endonuclease VII domain-containing protein [Actinomycetota bacterium]